MKRREFLAAVVGGGAAIGAASTRPVAGEHGLVPADWPPSAVASVPRDDRFWSLVRAQFPLAHDYAYLNTAGLGSSPFPVTHTVKAMMDREDEQPSATHSEEDWRRIRTKLAAFLGPGCSANEIALVSTATEGINLILNGLPLTPGDEVITSTHEHPALNIPLLHKIRTAGIVVQTFEPDLHNASNNVTRIRQLMTPRTRLVFISHVTCTTGQVFPVAAIAEVCRRANAWLALDGAQSYCQFPIDIAATGADFYTASGHKFLLGPKRTGILYVRRDRLALLRPSIVGAYSDRSWSMPERRLQLRPTAEHFEFGTQNDALVYGLEAAADFVAVIGLTETWNHNRALAASCAGGLRRVAGVEVLWPAEEAARSAIVTFRVRGGDNGEIASRLTARGIRVRRVTEAGLDAIRASFHVCNDEAHAARLVDEVRGVTS
jgi:selenocysteine lyase/cysteine desulfurase